MCSIPSAKSTKGTFTFQKSKIMNTCAKKLTQWLIENRAIEATDKELYEYAFYSIGITISPFVIVLIFGLWMGVPIEGVTMVLPFMCIRKYSGGYHAKSARTCFISSCIVLMICLWLVTKIRYGIWLGIFVFVSVCSIAYFSPIDSENRRLEEDEIQDCKKKSILISIVFLCLKIVFLILGLENFTVAISVGMILSAGLQFPAIVKNMCNEKDKK